MREEIKNEIEKDIFEDLSEDDGELDDSQGKFRSFYQFIVKRFIFTNNYFVTEMSKL